MGGARGPFGEVRSAFKILTEKPEGILEGHSR
jgi:hypothetical protein